MGRAATLVVLALGGLLHCSGSPPGDPSAGSGGAAIRLTFGGAANANGANAGRSGTIQCGDSSIDGCVGSNYEGEGIPLDIYVMFDQSGSMLNDVGGVTRLQAVQQATSAFLRDPDSAGIGVGIGYFGVQPIGQVSCASQAYATPDVAITLDHQRVIDSLSARMPTGETPTGAALQGACSYARSYRAATPGHAVVILLVTDGKPEAPVSCQSGGCCPTLDEATTAVTDCLDGGAGIPTYVLGVGPNLDNLSRIADAGGTHSAYLVGDQDVAANVLAALNSIRGDALIPCDLQIPTPSDGSLLDYNQLNVLVSDGSCEFEPFYYVRDAGHCNDEHGWYYDDASAPERVELCPASCERVRQPGTNLRLTVGCQTLPPPVR